MNGLLRICGKCGQPLPGQPARPRAPYNPHTLKQIKQGATAAQLGWDVEFYTSVCRKHGLSPVIPINPKPQAPPAIAEIAKPSKRDDVPTTESPGPVSHICLFDPRQDEITRGAITVNLSKQQGQLFAVLAALEPGHKVSGIALATAVGLSFVNLSNKLPVLRHKLAAAGIKLVALKGKNGGYWLADQRTGAVLHVVLA